jgi:hypothetical protein
MAARAKGQLVLQPARPAPTQIAKITQERQREHRPHDGMACDQPRLRDAHDVSAHDHRHARRPAR